MAVVHQQMCPGHSVDLQRKLSLRRMCCPHLTSLFLAKRQLGGSGPSPTSMTWLRSLQMHRPASELGKLQLAVSRAMGISQKTVWRTLHKRIHFTIHCMHQLQCDDCPRRSNFANAYLEGIAQEPNWTSNILCSDEAHFTNRGRSTMSNCVIWETDNLRFFTERPLQSTKKAVCSHQRVRPAAVFLQTWR